MHDIYETETYLKYHTEYLIQQAERERQMRQAKRLLNRESSEQFGLRVTIGFTRTPVSKLGQIVIEGELK
jgi:hypothetical protein